MYNIRDIIEERSFLIIGIGNHVNWKFNHQIKFNNKSFDYFIDFQPARAEPDSRSLVAFSVLGF